MTMMELVKEAILFRSSQTSQMIEKKRTKIKSFFFILTSI